MTASPRRHRDLRFRRLRHAVRLQLGGGPSSRRIGPKADALAEMWRAKQIQYTWLRNSMGAYAKFWQVTGEALDHCLAAHGIADAGVRDKLMGAYLALDPFPEVPAMLDRLKRAGMRLAILSNGNPEMLDPMVAASGLADRFEAVLSVDAVGVFKPDPRVYRLVEAALRRDAGQGVLPVIQLLGRAWRGAFRLRHRVGQPRRRARRQPARQDRGHDRRPLPTPLPARCFLMSASPTFADVQAAARRLEGITIRTPLLENARVNARLGGRLFIKAECLQRTGSFKLRGAYNFLGLDERGRPQEGRRRLVVGQPCAGAGRGGAPAGHEGHHRHAGRCAGAQGRQHPGLGRRGRALRPRQGKPRGDRHGHRARRPAPRSCRPTTIPGS